MIRYSPPLKVAYLGWRYSGFATQNDEVSTPTVEDQLFQALEACRLIADRNQCQFTRCGRTDKGVSGLGQVVALNVRSSNKKSTIYVEEPMSYIEKLNRLLPDDIRILAWASVNPSFNARFDCMSRTYKYFFQRDGLDLNAMRQAASYMVGRHDFRNFCRLDPSKNITSYERNILSLDINCVKDNLYEVQIKGTAFLWHQVRCIMAILFLTGQKLESPEIVKDLLDIQKFPAKPDYTMASDLPLLLYDCEFDDIDWKYSNGSTEQKDIIPTPIRTYRHFYEHYSNNLIKAQLYKTCFEEIEKHLISPIETQSFAVKEGQKTIIPIGAGKVLRTLHYKKLFDRPRADSDEVKKEKYRLRMQRKQLAQNP
ncbi:putative tRNA pseudouridine synthase C25B8.05 [Choanephora cucurbitarum]|uniref:Putative tRNA pseudouridine synthase C25B8.05 n=1 Tax=Choanephora cucurbitarum TaxID=101091 RepID=A0A1C7NHQ1_9FUNG|nr:putative tRNA pseudouridine synthase C25B8.05 [Choanephora cucurbitarum]